MQSPLISIGMSVFNNKDTIGRAVRSIVNQTFRDWELLIYDDGSTDGTADVLRTFDDERIVVLRDGKNRGLPARLNETIAAARGEFYARMDGDDVSYPERLELQLAYMNAHPEVDLMGSGICVVGPQGSVLGKRIPPSDHAAICRRPYSGFPLAHPTFFGRRKWFQSWLFRLEAGGACDQDLLLRSFATSKFANTSDILLGYREDGISLRKCYTYRKTFCRSQAKNCAYGNIRSTAIAIALNTVKLGFEAVAVTTGLQHRLLRHRARPASGVDVAQWQAVWATVNS